MQIITNIGWEFSIEDFTNELEWASDKYGATLLGITTQQYIDMSDEEFKKRIAACIKDIPPLAVYRILGLPNKIKIPDNVSDIQAYIYDRYNHRMIKYTYRIQ